MNWSPFHAIRPYAITIFLAVLWSNVACGRERELEQAIPTVAVIDDGETKIVPLLEAQLTTSKTAIWVERNQIETILKEQRLQAAFSADAVQQRARLGQLLKCDLLILIRTVPAPPGDVAPVGGPKSAGVIECTISETKHGLRLLTAYIPQDKDAESSVRKLVTAADQGIDKWRQKVVQVFAVPPLVSDD